MRHKLTEIQITPINPQNGLVAFASFILDQWLFLGSIGIVTRPEGGYRLVYPTKKVADKNLNIFHPIDRDLAKLVEDEVIKHFEKVMNYKNDRHNQTNAR